MEANINQLAESIELNLIREYAPLLYDEQLSKALGYRSLHAFRKAYSRKTVPVLVFTIPNRAGKYALTKDVAAWLAKSRCNAEQKNENRMENNQQGGEL